MNQTVGRKPTLQEVTDYYAREDFLAYLQAVCQERQVVMVHPKKAHWEPDWERDEILPDSIPALRASIRDKIEDWAVETGTGDRPAYYPSFHQSTARWGSRGRSGGLRLQDCVFEADLATWREAFRDVNAVLGLLDRYGVFYQVKFSGHRSLHVTIPAEVLPQGYRGRGAARLARHLLAWSSSQAHFLPRITRLPYSLNEDTGLVCLPLTRSALATFRPWQANLHLVEIDMARPTPPPADAAHLRELLEALEGTSVVHNLDMDIPRIRQVCAGRCRALQGAGAAGRAWHLLVAQEPISEQTLLDYLSSPEADARWLAAEAYVLHGSGLSQKTFLELLAQEEEYVHPAAVDIMLRFEDDLLPYLVEMLGDLEHDATASVRAGHLIAQSERLRQKVLKTIARRTGSSYSATITAACLSGASAGDWAGADALLAPIRAAADLTPEQRIRLEAVEQMRAMGGWDRKQEAAQAEALAQHGPVITDLVLLAAGSPDRLFRRAMVSTLALLADERAIDLLIHLLDDNYTKIRRRAITGLTRIGDKAVGPLIEATASDQVRIRRYAILCLGYIAAPRAREVVLDGLDDAEHVVRRQSVRSLKRLVAVDDVERLQRFLRRAEPESAMEAVDLLAALGEPSREALIRMAMGEQNLPAAYFMAREGDTWGAEVLAAHLKEAGPARDDAVEYLRALRDRRCVPFVVERLRAATDWEGTFLAHELGRIGGGEAVSALIEALARDNHLVRRGAALGLVEAGDPAAVPALVQALDDADGKVRRLAADALVAIGPASLEPLRSALAQGQIKGKHSRQLAQDALTKIEKKEQTLLLGRCEK